MRTSVRRAVMGPALVALVMAGVAAPVRAAATITVTTKVDEYGTGAACSLREAIEAANTDTAFGGCPAGSGTDTIVLDTGRYRLMGTAGTEEDANADGDLDITAPVRIRGAGATRTTIDGNGERTHERVVHIVNGTRTVFLDLTVRNGLDGTSEGGGAIFSDYGSGALILRQVHIIANFGGSYGGGVSMYGDGPLHISRSLISDNDTDSYGGGVYSYDNDVTIEHSTIAGNTGDDSGGGVYLDNIVSALLRNVRITGNQVTDSYYGGGIYIDASETVRIVRSTIASNAVIYDGGGSGGGIFHYDGNLLIRDTTVDGNFSSDDGGALYQDGGTVTIRSSTFSHNGATDDGGAIYQNDGHLRITNSTITRNSAYWYSGGIYADGLSVDLNNVTIYRNQSYSSAEGIGFYDDNAMVTFANSLIAKNRYEGGGTYHDCYGGTSAGNNLVSDGVDCGTTAGDIVGDSTERIDPALGPLQDNGGFTLTHVPQAWSPAIGAGGPDCETLDQRGVARAAECDIGAVER